MVFFSIFRSSVSSLGCRHLHVSSWRFLALIHEYVSVISSAFGEAGDGVAHFAHLGGLITGLLYLKTDWKISSQIKKFIRIKWGRFLSIFIRDKTEDSYSTLFRADNSKIDAKEKAMLDAVDVVLDKISAEGISSLTETERKLLDEVSRKHRTN